MYFKVTVTLQDEIIHTVQRACTLLPKTVRSVCTDFISQNGNRIIQLLIASVDPKEVCTELGICTSSDEGMSNLHIKH